MARSARSGNRAGVVRGGDAPRGRLGATWGHSLREGYVVRPPLFAMAVDSSEVVWASTMRAASVVRAVERLISQWRSTPGRVLKRGVVDVRDLRRFCSAAALDPTAASVVVEVAGGAGLVAVDMEHKRALPGAAVRFGWTRHRKDNGRTRSRLARYTDPPWLRWCTGDSDGPTAACADRGSQLDRCTRATTTLSRRTARSGPRDRCRRGLPVCPTRVGRTDALEPGASQGGDDRRLDLSRCGVSGALLRRISFQARKARCSRRDRSPPTRSVARQTKKRCRGQSPAGSSSGACRAVSRRNRARCR